MQNVQPVQKSYANTLARMFFKFVALNFNNRPSLNRYLKSDDGWINFTFGIKTENGSVEQAMRFENGKVTVLKNIPETLDSQLIFVDENALKEAATQPPNKLMLALMENRMITIGNLGYLQLINLYLSLLVKQIQIAKLKKEAKTENRKYDAAKASRYCIEARKPRQLKAVNVDPGVRFLNDPYLAQYSLDDFPRVKEFLDIHLKIKPAICHERAELVTQWFKENGFEKDKNGKPWVSELRQAQAFQYLMANKKPIIRKNDLIAGTTTTKDIGVIIYPEAHGTMIWGELLTVPYRPLNPYNIDADTLDVLHNKVFPFWLKRNFREWVRDHKDYPLCQKLDERFAACFLWKTVALSHTILNYPEVLSLGTSGIISKIDKELSETPESEKQKRDTLQAMKISLEGMNAYAGNLAQEAWRLASQETQSVRKNELLHLAEICKRVPAHPCTTLDEAVNALWIIWVGVHMENTNAGFSLGRLDQWLQPYFTADMKKIQDEKERQEYVKHAIELIGCFYMRCTDHLPLIPDIGNYLFGGSSSDQAITLGGVTPDGEDAVNDMTYIFLKVTEMLSIRDPNVNARYNKSKNSATYLKRLCEVNINTTATPSIHNDEAVMASLAEFNYPPEHLRDWSATGCVEPTLSGRHIGHTNCMMFNMVAALEMALNNGRHPLMRWDLGPKTGDIRAGAFPDFESFFNAFAAQLRFLADQTCEYNNLLGEAHQHIRPTPFISALIEGPLKKGKDVTKGGARYNSSGTACIGLADITDSLMVVKKLVFEEKKITFERLLDAVNTNFRNDSALLAQIKNKIALFGSGNEEALATANRVIKLAHDIFGEHTNYRNGKYTAGFWSMSNHVAFGTLTGALPSGRLAGKAFTPGLTPEPHASKNILDNIRDVAKLKAENMNNNIAFNVKVVPGAQESHQKVVDNIYSYVKTYSDLGGMQMQLNVVSSKTLRDAMEHPENYQNLLVRISGYNAYFVTLNREMQIELIERAEFGI
ncbi:MAG TPA: pyruvate formate lyase family protein [Smithella sp.]|jgi:formate C-acetyltransferase|nr:pyruvate formate lyase family protein [Smithella sp.]HOO36025.1 pyruvate formate lyase family protein [Smithella sp.]HOS14936.1 pyruvate formate lyase family protein [Smithella sp.]HPK23153.1 pyruvate formate lyase family protein [Smithella sp.]HPL48547.1 pyruvate formate lyase family protein [Smithella sp.]